MHPIGYLSNHVAGSDLARLKRLGDRRAALLRELQRINTEIQETAKDVSEISNGLYERSVYWS